MTRKMISTWTVLLTLVNEVTTTVTDKGTVTTQIARKWTFTGEGQLTIDLYIDGPNGSYETKRIFTKK